MPAEDADAADGAKEGGGIGADEEDEEEEEGLSVLSCCASSLLIFDLWCDFCTPPSATFRSASRVPIRRMGTLIA